MSLTSDTAGFLTGLLFPWLCCSGLPAPLLPALHSCPPHGISSHIPWCCSLKAKQLTLVSTAKPWKIVLKSSNRPQVLILISKSFRSYPVFHLRVSRETLAVYKPKELTANMNSLLHIPPSCPADPLMSAYITSFLPHGCQFHFLSALHA